MVIKTLVLLLLCAPACLAAKTADWSKIVAPHFTLYANTSPKDALKSADELQLFIAALRVIVPVDPRSLQPLTVVIFERDNEFRPFRPLAPNGKPRDVAGFFVRAPSWSVFGLTNTALDDDARSTIYHEAVHWFFSGDEGARPAWLEEGVAEVFSTFRVDAKGLANWGEAIPEHVFLLREKKALPLDKLLSVTSSDPLFNEDLRTGVFYASSWAFVHYLLFGEQTGTRIKLEDFIQAQRSGSTADEAFASVFPAGYAQMDKTLTQYMRRGRYFQGANPRPADLPELHAEPSSETELAIAFARLALGSGQLALASDHADQAATLSPDSPVPHELKGAIAQARKDSPGAIAALERAARLKSTDFLVYYNLAQYMLSPTGEPLYFRAALQSHEARRIADYLEQAINRRKSYLPAFQNLGRVIDDCEAWTEQDMRFLRLGLRQYPHDLDIHLGIAALEWKSGAKNAARHRIQPLLDAPSSSEPRAAREARSLARKWADQEFEAALAQDLENRHYKAALARLDAELAQDASVEKRYNLQNRRRFIAADALANDAIDAINDRQHSQARALLHTLLASDAPESAKRRAQTLLDQIAPKAPE